MTSRQDHKTTKPRLYPFGGADPLSRYFFFEMILAAQKKGARRPQSWFDLPVLDFIVGLGSLVRVHRSQAAIFSAWMNLFH